MHDLYALDFDGVICNSVDETAVSAWRAASQLWPELSDSGVDSLADIIGRFRSVRPYLETGYQAIIMIRMLADKAPLSAFRDDLPQRVEHTLLELGKSKENLISLFGAVRDTWLREDLPSWLQRHSFYPGVIDALREALQRGKRLYILTTKQERFVAALFKSQQLPFPQELIWGLERNVKKDALLLELLKEKNTRIHFVEDRLDTLLNVSSNAALQAIQLYFAPWGYATPIEKKRAEDDPTIHCLQLEEFTNWLAQ
jgi:phosphoglycolate phosphatase-like HAD superfamily hydrolase